MSLQVRWLTAFVDLPAVVFDEGIEFWKSVLGSEISSFRGENAEFATFLPPVGDACLRVQRLREGPARTHLDLHVPESVLVESFAEAQRLGARRVEDWLVSPGGYAFCIVPWEGESVVPSPVGGARADQLCLDIPAPLHEREVAFWADLIGWPLHVDDSEFSYLRRPDDTPLWLLLQRLDSTDGAVGGHIDFAAGSDVDGLAASHVAAGARVVAEFDEWTTLATPYGQLYCVTHRDPVHTTR